MNPESKILTHRLAECIHACNDCMNGCLDEKHVSMMAECIRLDKECADICTATLALVHHGGYFAKEILSLCVKACKACADECSKHPEAHCTECAAACRECAAVCAGFLAGLE